jgi:hypothetical protein
MGLTKVQSGIITSGLNFSATSLNATGISTIGIASATSINVTGVVTATGGIDAIGIQSGGVTITSGIITALNFVGTGNTFVVRGNTVDISVGGAGGASIVYDSTVFGYDNVIDSDISIASPYKTSSIYTDPDVTVDIESGVTVSVGDGCILNVIDV